MISKLFYLMTILAFSGTASVMGLISIRKNIRKYAKILVISSLFAIIITPIYEPVAIYYGAWAYGAAYMLNVHILGAEAETYLYSFFVMLSIACATLIFADLEEKGELSASFLLRRLMKN